MKKLPFVFLLVIFLFYLPVNAFAINKLGVNIAARHEEFEKAAKLVGPGGWVVIMASPGNADELKPILSSHPEVNIILRGHCPSDPLGPDEEENRKFALSWTATLGGLDTAGRKIFFMPWNEPNMTRECQGTGDDYNPNNTECAPYVVQYIKDLRKYLSDSGLLGNKVELLSPMINQHHANYETFISAMKTGGINFSTDFYGISVNLYDNENCGSPLCHIDPKRNAKKINESLDSVGLGGLRVFAVETGIIAPNAPGSISDYPVFDDSRMFDLISQAWPTWVSTGNFIMFSPLSYNPETNESSWIYGGDTAGFYNSTKPKTGSAFSGSTPRGFNAWRDSDSQGLTTCSQSQSTYILPGGHCGFCAGGANLMACKPIKQTDQFGEEYSRNSINIPQEAAYRMTDAVCLAATFSGKLSLTGLNIPFVNELNKYFLGPYVDNLKARQAKKEVDLIKDYGVLEKLAPTEIQDGLKLKFLEEISQSGYSGRYQNFRIEGKTPQEIANTFERIKEKEKNGEILLPKEEEFQGIIWTQVPFIANEESSGEVVFSGTGIDSSLSVIKTSIPEVFRLNKVTELIKNMLVPQTSPGPVAGLISPSQVLAASVCKITEGKGKIENQKKGKTGPGNAVCAKDEIQEAGKELAGERIFLNDAEESCASLPKQESHQGEFDKCCGNRGKYVSTYYGYSQCIESESCGSCWTGELYSPTWHGDNCCVKEASSKSKIFTDLNLNSLNRVPFLNSIADNTVNDSGLFRIFVPAPEKSQVKELEQTFQDVAGEATANLKIDSLKVTKNFGSFTVNEGNPISQPLTLLFHKLGTLFNVQQFVSGELFWPFRFGSELTGGPPGKLTYTLAFKDANVLPTNETCVKEYLQCRFPQNEINTISPDQTKTNWETVIEKTKEHGWNPAFVLALWIEETAAGGYHPHGHELGCEAGNEDIISQLDCLFRNFDSETNFEKFMCTYSEGHYPCTEFTTNKKFPENLKNWYDQLTGNCSVRC